MAFARILVVDDELIIRKSLAAHLQKKRYAVATAGNLAEARAVLERDVFDFILLDERLPDGTGSEFLESLPPRREGSPFVVMMSAHATVDSAIKCLRLGAFDYLLKPFSLDQLDVALKRAENFHQLVQVNQYYSEELNKKTELLGNCPAMQRLKTMIAKVATTEATVLVTGENGTGKELVARELFRQSQRAAKPFITVNCAAMSENLIESEFFGHEKGAFTGALQRRPGRFELADGGTILLDEIGEISPRIQAKLLRVLQEREFERVGGNKTIRVNVRIIATTNRDLLAAVQRGEFREDLYYRLSVFPLEVPALRERGDDVLLLANRFAQDAGRKHGTRVAGFAGAAQQRLMRHPWPGNVRELQNAIERAVIMTEPGAAIAAEMLHLPQLGVTPAVAAETAMPGAGAGFALANGSTGQAEPMDLSSGPPIRNGATWAVQGSYPAAEVPLVGAIPTPVPFPGFHERAPAPVASPVYPTMPNPSEPARPEGAVSPGRVGDFPVLDPREDAEAAAFAPADPLAAEAPAAATEAATLSLAELEQQHIIRTLIATNGNRTDAAEILQVSTRTLRNKIAQYRDEGVSLPFA